MGTVLTILSNTVAFRHFIGKKFAQAARRSYLWCRPPTSGTVITAPTDCTGRESGESRSRSRSKKFGAVSKGKASTICCAVHSAVGWAVTLKWRMRRRLCASTINTNRTSNQMVGTVKKSTTHNGFRFHDEHYGAPARPD